MASALKNDRYFGLQLYGGLILSVLVATPVLNSAAAAQETAMRSTIDPESPLAQSALSKKPARRNIQAAPVNTSENETPRDQSGDDSQSDTFQPFFSEDTLSEANQNADGTNSKPKTGLNGQLKSDGTDDLAVNADENTTESKNTAIKGKAKVLDPDIDVQTTGTLVVRKGQKTAMLRAQPEIAAEAVQSRQLTEEENPFRAVGLRFGAITLRPSLEQGIESTTNGTASAGGGSAVNSVTTLRLDGVSDWRDGSLEASSFVTLRNRISGNSNNDPEAGATIKLTQPLLQDWTYSLGASYGLKRESAVSGFAFPATITKRPLAQDLRLLLDIGKTQGLLQPSAKLELGRLVFGNANDALGASISQSDRNQTSLRGTLRLGAELSPALTPFIEASYGQTWRDQTVDSFGNDRSSSDMRASIGAKINGSEKLNGEISVGWLRQSFGSAGLADINGLALAAALNWSPVRRTTITAQLTTNAEPANSATISGSLLYSANLGVTHQLSSRFSTSASLGYSYRDFTGTGGHDKTLSAELAATYMVNRMLGVNAKARYETVSSSDATRVSDTTTFLLGLKIQR